ncbi:MAG: hypothetical protein ACP5D1_08450 [Bacteroidales bacterium]
MKHAKSVMITATALSLLVISCSERSESGTQQGVTQEMVNKDETLNDKLAGKIGDWVEKGVECYGIVVTTFQDGRTVGKSVKCKVMSIGRDKVKMKAIENVSLMESIGCDALGLSYGDTWWETEGDIFQTREEADNYLLQKGWLIE